MKRRLENCRKSTRRQQSRHRRQCVYRPDTEGRHGIGKSNQSAVSNTQDATTSGEDNAEETFIKLNTLKKLKDIKENFEIIRGTSVK